MEDFDSSDGRLPDGWRPVLGSWRVEDDALVGDSLDGEAVITFGDPAWQNCEIEVSVAFLEVKNDSRWASIVFRALPDGSPPWFQFPLRQKSTAAGGVEFAVRLDEGWSVRQRGSDATDCELGRPRRLRVVVSGTVVRGYLDGRPVIESPFCLERATGCVGLAASGCRAKFDDFSVRRLPDTLPVAVAPQPCDIVAHRGFSAIAPENTLAAIRKGIGAGADACEFDVRKSKDGVIVLLHDETVDRTTNGAGKVADLTLADLRKLDAGSWKDACYAGEPLPTLEEALALLADCGGKAVIEIKVDGIAEEVLEAVRAADMLQRASVIAFSQQAVQDIRRLEPELPCGWLHGKSASGDYQQRAAWIAEEAARCGTSLVDLNYNLLFPEVVAELRRRGLEVWTWTVNDPPVMQALSAWGVKSITTDRPDEAVRALGRAAPR